MFLCNNTYRAWWAPGNQLPHITRQFIFICSSSAHTLISPMHATFSHTPYRHVTSPQPLMFRGLTRHVVKRASTSIALQFQFVTKRWCLACFSCVLSFVQQAVTILTARRERTTLNNMRALSWNANTELWWLDSTDNWRPLYESRRVIVGTEA